MKPIRVAILGATSHVAKGLIACWAPRRDRELFLYARSPERVDAFVDQLELFRGEVHPFGEFGSAHYDVVVNCVGIGSPLRLKENLHEIFRLTSTHDDLVLDYLARYPQALYVSLSSGAAYGADFAAPVEEHSKARFGLNDLQAEEFYGIAKLHAEARHRALSGLNIVDVRIFGFFSRYIDLTEKFLLSEIIACVKEGRKLSTGPSEIWRDFLHPGDLAALIDCCIARGTLNAAYDAFSAQQVSKFEILRFFEETYCLRYEVDESFQPLTVTGQKDHYYPAGRKAREVGYAPLLTSLRGISVESCALLGPGRASLATAGS